MPDRSHKILVLGGPTASGKSGLALALARRLGGSVINADSQQLYRALPVLTAQPDAEQRAKAPHALYGVLDADARSTAASWARLAVAAIDAARAEGRLPIVVGGTGFYLKALVEGMAPMPEVAQDVRAVAMAAHARLGGPGLHAQLAQHDAASAARLRPSDTQRLVRAWEVWLGTGRPLSHWQAAAPERLVERADVVAVALDPPRAALRAACDARFAAMVEAGALDEVRALLARAVPDAAPVRQALGFAALAAHLGGTLPLARALAAGSAATRQYAKRQVTWFRHQFPADLRLAEDGAAPWFSAQSMEMLEDRIVTLLRE